MRRLVRSKHNALPTPVRFAAPCAMTADVASPWDNDLLLHSCQLGHVFLFGLGEISIRSRRLAPRAGHATIAAPPGVIYVSSLHKPGTIGIHSFRLSVCGIQVDESPTLWWGERSGWPVLEAENLRSVKCKARSCQKRTVNAI